MDVKIIIMKCRKDINWKVVDNSDETIWTLPMDSDLWYEPLK